MVHRLRHSSTRARNFIERGRAGGFYVSFFTRSFYTAPIFEIAILSSALGAQHFDLCVLATPPLPVRTYCM